MTERIGVGVVGAGMIGTVHSRNLAGRLKAAQLVAVADMDVARAEQAAREAGSATAYSDGDELIADPAVEAVVIASPDHTHAHYVLACLRAGKPVMCEKPLATTAAEAVAVMNEEARSGRRSVQVGFMREFDPPHVAVREATEAGRVGRPLMFRGIHVNRTAGAVPASTDGVITASLIHDIHSARFLMRREITSVYASSIAHGDPPEPGTCRLLTLSCRFDDGALGLIHVNVEAGYGYEVLAEVIGTHGTVATAHPHRSTLAADLERRREIAAGFEERFAEAYLLELEAWLASLSAAKPVGPSAWDGYASLAVADACRGSVATGLPVEVRLVDRPALYG